MSLVYHSRHVLCPSIFNEKIIEGYGINPLHPNIGMDIPHTVLYTFPKVLTRRICLSIKRIFSW